MFRPVYSGAKFATASSPTDFFSVNDLQINGISVIGHKEQEGRSLMMNWFQRLSKKFDSREAVSLPNDLSRPNADALKSGFSTNGSTSVKFIDPLHLYNSVPLTGTLGTE